MSDRSISFKDPLILEIEADRKTKTRRLVRCDWQNTVEPKEHSQRSGYWLPYLADGRVANGFAGDRKGDCGVTAPWTKGDRLWVKQRLVKDAADRVCWSAPHQRVMVDGVAVPWPWKPRILGAMYCPRWASRLTIEVTDVRIERLNDITEADAKAEGVEPDLAPCEHEGHACADVACLGPGHRAAFAVLWDSINRAKAPWRANPWVWVVSFVVVR